MTVELEPCPYCDSLEVTAKNSSQMYCHECRRTWNEFEEDEEAVVDRSGEEIPLWNWKIAAEGGGLSEWKEYSSVGQPEISHTYKRSS